MPCYHPLTAYKWPDSGNGARPLHFLNKENKLQFKNLTGGKIIKVACGQCIGCRLERSRQWAIRCLHEAQMHDENCFLTLTYDEQKIERLAIFDENEPDKVDYSLSSGKGSDIQKFMKRLRKRYENEKIRFFQCGEYGDKYSRPHHHVCLFGKTFKDVYPVVLKNGRTVFTSPSVSELWPYGFNTVGEVTFESAAYVARYVTKKLNGEKVNEYDGRAPEFTTMSRRPGIGKRWYDLYESDVRVGDCVVLRGGIKCKPAKYYDSLFDVQNHNEMQKIKIEREKRAGINYWNNTRERLLRREHIVKHNTLKRSYENA